MQSDSILRITDLREEDSAEYKFRFRTDQTNWEPTFTGTTLTLTGLQVKVTPATVTEGQKVTLTCITTCTLSDNPNPTYIWYKNGHVTTQSNSLFLNPVSSEDAGRYSCAVEGHENLLSPEETLTVRCEYVGSISSCILLVTSSLIYSIHLLFQYISKFHECTHLTAVVNYTYFTNTVLLHYCLSYTFILIFNLFQSYI
uniref:Ig-like domain-containing protein n=1 Tax=Hucho hucho TaxID=62062 RepID=A0A4W5L8B7_9TELE